MLSVSIRVPCCQVMAAVPGQMGTVSLSAHLLCLWPMPVESDPPGLNLVVLPVYFRQIYLISASLFLAPTAPYFNSLSLPCSPHHLRTMQSYQRGRREACTQIPQSVRNTGKYFRLLESGICGFCPVCRAQYHTDWHLFSFSLFL